MKRFMILLMLLIPCTLYAGEYIDLPYDVVVSDPLTHQAEKMSIRINWQESGDHFATCTYKLLNPAKTKTLYTYSFQIRNMVDNPYSITSECTDVGVPWPLCSGLATCDNDCDETTTDFNDFMSGIGATLNSRAEAAMSADLQKRHTTQALP